MAQLQNNGGSNSSAGAPVGPGQRGTSHNRGRSCARNAGQNRQRWKAVEHKGQTGGGHSLKRRRRRKSHLR